MYIEPNDYLKLDIFGVYPANDKYALQGYASNSATLFSKENHGDEFKQDQSKQHEYKNPVHEEVEKPPLRKSY